MPTIYEIARAAGVSPTTVSRALSGKGVHNAPSTCERIRRLAERMGYRRNTFAAAVRKGRCGTIGFLRSSMEIHAQIPETFRYGLNEALAKSGELLITGMVAEDELASGRLPRLAREWAVDGLVLFYTHGDWSGLGRKLEELRLPSVWVNNKLPHNSIYPDDLAAGRMAAQTLAKSGCRHIACFSLWSTGHYSETDRRKGFLAAARRLGIQAEDCSASDNSNPQTWSARADEMVSRARGFDGIFCYGPTEIVALFIAAARQQIRIPDDLSLITICWKPVCISGQPVDTLVMPYGETIAPLTVTRLLEQIGRGDAFPSIPVKPKLVPGTTTRNSPKNRSQL